MAKRTAPRKRSVRTPAPTSTPKPKPATANGLADKIAIGVGSTLGRLMNRKDALLAQLSDVEAKIASASRRASDQLKTYLPAAVSGRKGTRKAKKPATRPRSSRPAPAPPVTHGRDAATAETMRAARTPSARTHRSTAPARTAPRATGRG